MTALRIYDAGCVRCGHPELAHLIPKDATHVLMRGDAIERVYVPPLSTANAEDSRRWAMIRGQRRSEITRLICDRRKRRALSKPEQAAFAEAIASVIEIKEAAAWIREYCDLLVVDELEDVLTDATFYPIRWTASWLGDALELTKDERARCKIKTFRWKGATFADLKAERRRKNTEGQKAKRALTAKPKPVSLRKAKPWLAFGISERTFFRLKKAGDIVVDVAADGSTSVTNIISEETLLMTGILPNQLDEAAPAKAGRLHKSNSPGKSKSKPRAAKAKAKAQSKPTQAKRPDGAPPPQDAVVVANHVANATTMTAIHACGGRTAPPLHAPIDIASMQVTGGHTNQRLHDAAQADRKTMQAHGPLQAKTGPRKAMAAGSAGGRP